MRWNLLLNFQQVLVCLTLTFATAACISVYGSVAQTRIQQIPWKTKEEDSVGFRKTTRVPFGSSSFVTTLSLWKVGSYDATGTTRSHCRTALFMGKGDGKNKKKKKKKTSALSSSVEAQQGPPPQRVSTDINVPIRMQIKYGQMRKERTKQAGASYRKKKVERTAFRRKWTDDEIEVKREERKRKGQDPDWDLILNNTSVKPLVLVDGYNIIHKWPRLKKHMNKGDLERARRLLVDDLENLRANKGWRIELVFDGTGRSLVGPLGQGPGKPRATEQDRASKANVSKHGVRVVFTGVGVEADSYIQSRCHEASQKTDGKITSSFIIASDDSMIRLSGSVAGAHCMSAQRMVDELKAVRRITSYRVEAAVAEANGHDIRPEKLRGRPSSFTVDRVVVVDMRNRTKVMGKKKLKKMQKRREQMDSLRNQGNQTNATES